MNAMASADRSLAALGDFDAFVLRGLTWRAKTIHDHAMRVAAGLCALGTLPGDRVLLWLPNSPELVIAWRAVLRAGGVPVVVHHDSPPARVEQLAAETRPAALIAAATHATAELDAATVRCKILAGSARAGDGWIELAHLAGTDPPLVTPVPRADDDIALLQYTSGSTGTPVGIITRHSALGARIRARRKRFPRWRRTVRVLSVLPMSGAMGSAALSEGLSRKCTHYLIDGFDPERVLKAIEQHKIERTALVPAMCQALLAVPDLHRFDLSSLRTVVCGGAVVPAALVERFQAAFGIRLEISYGMTGIGGVSFSTPRSKPGSAGRLAPHLRARIVDAQGRTLPAGEVGELWLSLNEKNAIEYWNRDGTAAADAVQDGWYRTGDLARIAADGDLWVVGRSDDLIIQGGHNVHAHAVAEIIERLPEVRECAVVGVPSDFLGQEVVACVALRAHAELSAEQILAHCRAHLDALAVPTAIRFVAALPRNESGKVRSPELRRAIAAARGIVRETGLVRKLRSAPPAERREILRQEIGRLVAALLAAAGRRPPAEGQSFHDMGLDSLAAVELTYALSDAIGRPVPATITYSHPTVDLVCGGLMALMGWATGPGAAPAAIEIAPRVDLANPQLDAFLTPAELAAAQALPAPVAGPPKVLFLTGASGFLGRFIALDLLARLPPDGRVYCLVRSANAAAARERLCDAFRLDPDLHTRIGRDLERGRLIVLAGDLTRPRLGLSEEDYDRLCDEVECIVHAGARVDHVLGDEALFAPNVLGTVEIVRLALARRIKPIDYVSTLATLRPERKRPDGASGQTADGYVRTKRASELLLKELHERCGVPVRVYRPCQIMAHRLAAGQINPEDTLTRLLHGIVTTGVAPKSFYAATPTRAFYDGLPVDFVAQAIACLSMAGPYWPQYAEFNIANPHREGSLDTITDWVRSAGHPVERIDDYRAWHAAFKSRLNALSRRQRERSLLPLIHAWENPREAGARAPYDMANTQQYLAQMEFPAVTEAFVHKCLDDMRRLNLIGSPP